MSNIFIFHMLIGLYEDMTPVDFVFTWSKVKVTMVTFVINYFLISLYLFMSETVLNFYYFNLLYS